MIFAVSNQKGGVGKTTSVLNIGVYLAHKGHKTLVIDSDPQANLTSGLGMVEEIRKEEEAPKTIYNLLVDRIPAKEVIVKTRIEGLDLLPSGIELAGAEVEIVNTMSRENILKNALSPIKDEYDFILIDCPPSLGLITINSQVAAEKVLIPVQTEYYALEGLGQLLNTIKLVQANLNPNLEIGGVVLTMFDTRTNLSKDVAKEIQNFFGNKLFDTVIPRNVKLSEAPSHGLSIREYEAESTGALAYSRLTDEIIERFAKKRTQMIRPNL